jgi:hypothetical protein
MVLDMPVDSRIVVLADMPALLFQVQLDKRFNLHEFPGLKADLTAKARRGEGSL